MIENSDDVIGVSNGQCDLFFACQHCGIALVVDRAAAGAAVTCGSCGKPITVPKDAEGPAKPDEPETSEKLSELRRQLKENESQRTEVKGYINQLSIQLHRWQLRLQVLEERSKALTTEIGTLCPGES